MSILLNGSFITQCNYSNQTVLPNGTRFVAVYNESETVSPPNGSNRTLTVNSQVQTTQGGFVVSNTTGSQETFRGPTATSTNFTVFTIMEMFRNDTNDFFRNTSEAQGIYADVNGTTFDGLTRRDAFGQTNGTNATFFLITNLTEFGRPDVYREQRFIQNDTINGTNNSNTTFREYQLDDVTLAGNNETLFVSNQSATYPNTSNLSNFTQFNRSGLIVRPNMSSTFTSLNETNTQYANGSNIEEDATVRIDNNTFGLNTTNASYVFAIFNRNLTGTPLTYNYNRTLGSVYNGSNYTATQTLPNGTTVTSTFTNGSQFTSDALIIASVNDTVAPGNLTFVSLQETQVQPRNATFFDFDSYDENRNINFTNGTRFLGVVDYLKIVNGTNASFFSEALNSSVTGAYNFTNGTNTNWANFTNTTANPRSTGLDNSTVITLINMSMDTNTSANRSIANYNIFNQSNITNRNLGQNESSFNVTVGFANDSNVSDTTPLNVYNYTFANTSINRTNGSMENTSTNSLNITGGDFCRVDQVNSYNFNSSVMNPANNLSVFTDNTNTTLQNFTNTTMRTGFNNIVSCNINLTSNFSFMNVSTGQSALVATITVNSTENLTYNFNNTNSTSIAVVNNSLNTSVASGLNNTTTFINTTTAIRDPNNFNGTFLNNLTTLSMNMSFAPEIRFVTAPDGTLTNQTIGNDNITNYRYVENQSIAANSTPNATGRTLRVFVDERNQTNTTEIEPISNLIFYNFFYSAAQNETANYSNATSQRRECLYEIFNTSSPVGTAYSEFNCTNVNCTDPALPNACLAVVVSNFSDPNFNGDNLTRVTRYNTISDNRTNPTNNSFFLIDFSENASSSTGSDQTSNISRDTALANNSREITFNATTNSLVNNTGNNVVTTFARNYREVIGPNTTTFQRYYDSTARTTTRPNADGARTERFNEILLFDNQTDINPVVATRTNNTTPFAGTAQPNPIVVNNFTRNLVQTNYTGTGPSTLPDTLFLNQTQRLRNINALDLVYIDANN